MCGAAWPCSAAKLALLGEYRENRTSLLIYLGTLMDEAMTDLAARNGQVPPERIADRFLTWARARQ